jgi:hypothetical protein
LKIYYLIKVYEKVDCYTFANDVFTIDVHYKLNKIEKVIFSGLHEDASLNEKLTLMLKNEKYQEFEDLLVKIMKFQMNLKNFGNEKFYKLLEDFPMSKKSIVGIEIPFGNISSELSLLQQNGQYIFVLSFHSPIYIPHHGLEFHFN